MNGIIVSNCDKNNTEGGIKKVKFEVLVICNRSK